MIIIDADGAERDWAWVVSKYNLPPIIEAPRDRDHWEVVELHEQIGNASMTVRLVGEEVDGVPVKFGWPGEAVIQGTNAEGHTGFGMGPGAYYRPAEKHGPHYVEVFARPSDRVDGLGMIAGTNHAHLEPTFQFMMAETPDPPSPPPTDCEEYISALKKIRKIVNDFVLPL